MMFKVLDMWLENGSITPIVRGPAYHIAGSGAELCLLNFMMQGRWLHEA